MRILMIGSDAEMLRSGSAASARAAAYAAAAGEVQIIVRAGRGAAVSLRHGDHLAVSAAPCRHPALFFFSARAAERRLSSKRWDVVTSQDPFEGGLAAWVIARRRGAKFELQMHGDFLNPAWAAEAWHRPLRLVLARFLLRRADGVRVVSARLARSLHGIVPDERITVVPVAVQAIAPAAAPVAADEVRYAGRFTSEKNLPLLIRAFASAAARHPAARLVLVGDGPELPRVRATIVASGAADKIRIEPWTNGSAIAAAGIIALPSLHESWSRLAVEAALAGRAVVMTDVGCAGEVIVDGESGWVVPPNNEPAFAAALVDALSRPDEPRRRGENARRVAAALPNAEEIVRRVVAAWEKLARA